MPKIGDIKSLEILFALLPGLLAYLIVRYLTARERKPESLEVVLHGLAYTLLAHAVWELVQYLPTYLRPHSDLLGLSTSALLLGFFVSYLVNTDRIYSLLRKLGLTKEASWSTIWESTFREFQKRQGKYAILTLGDRRRVYGWLVAYSSEQQQGHICLQDVIWLEAQSQVETSNDPDALKDWMNSRTRSEIKGLHLFKADDVKFLHFITPQTEG